MFDSKASVTHFVRWALWKAGTYKLYELCQNLTKYVIQVYIRLQKVNLTLSHRATVMLLSNLGVNFDSKVHGWQEVLADSLLAR